MVTGDQLNMAVFFWYLEKRDLSSVHDDTCTVAYTGQVTFQNVPEKTQPCLTEQTVQSVRVGPLHLYLPLII